MEKFSPKRLATRVTIVGGLMLGAKTADQGSFRSVDSVRADAVATATATPDYSFDAGKFLPRPNIIASKNKWTTISAGEICLGDVKDQSGKVINTDYDNASQTAMIIETTSKAATTLVKINPPFGTVYCYPDTKQNLTLLKTAAKTINGKPEPREIVDVLQKPSSQIQNRNRTFNWAPASTDGSYPYDAKKQFNLKKGFAVLGDLKQKDPKTGVLIATYDSNANTAEIVIANDNGIIVENDFGSGVAVPADAKHIAALKAQVTGEKIDINNLNNKTVSVEGGATQVTTPATTSAIEATPAATATSVPQATVIPATATPVGLSETANSSIPANTANIGLSANEVVIGDVSLPAFPSVHPDTDPNTAEIVVNLNPNTQMTAPWGAETHTYNGVPTAPIINSFVIRDARAKQVFYVSGTAVSEEIVPAGGSFDPSQLQSAQ